MKRRNFIKLSATASAIGLLPTEFYALEKAIPFINSCQLGNRKLVLINLAGGNDGLNTLIPINQYDNYATLRPSIGISSSGTNAYVPLDSSLADQQLIGLHPALTGFKSMYDQGILRIVQSVGYPSQNRSHFASTDLYMSGNDGNSLDNGSDSGWIGRFMERYYDRQLSSNQPLAIEVGSQQTSLGFHGVHEHGMSINLTGQDPGGFYSILSGLGGLPPDNIPNSDYGNALNYIIRTDALSNTYSNSISSAFNNGYNSASYPDTDLADQLKTVAKLISGGLESKIYMVRISGFDTHNNQIEANSNGLGKHYDLLNELSTAVQAFYQDINGQSFADDIVAVTFSEFGRKAAENGNYGTDHGEVAPMFVLGNPVQGGVSGINPDLSKANSDNKFQLQEVQYDYRQAFGTLLQDFLGASTALIDETFFDHTHLDSFSTKKITEILRPDFSVPSECYSPSLTHKNVAQENFESYPNPVQDLLNIALPSEVTSLNYAVINIKGQRIKNKTVVVQNNKVLIDFRAIPRGVYVLLISGDHGFRKTLKISKK